MSEDDRLHAVAEAELLKDVRDVLGLGGWFAGVLLVITTMPGTPLDDPWLATISVGFPIGLGI